MREPAGTLVGFRVLGRNGELGVVEFDDAEGASDLVVRGGVSSGLVYLVSREHAMSVSIDRRTILVDVELHDFLPSLRPDGTVELRLPGRREPTESLGL